MFLIPQQKSFFQRTNSPMFSNLEHFFEPFYKNGLDSTLSEEAVSFVPQLDVADHDNEVSISVDLPGLDEKDIEIEVSPEGDVLTLKGERKDEFESNENGVSRRERVYGTFKRSLSLPETIDTENIAAKFSNGVLKLTLPKKEILEKKSRKISLTAN